MSLYPLIAIVTLGGLLYAKKVGSLRLAAICKPVTSLLFILTALSGGIMGEYDIRLFIGLTLGLLGDMALIPKSRMWFLVGMIAFLAGHVFYILAFNSLTLFTRLYPLGAGLIAAMGAGAAIRFWPHLGNMRIPVAAYILTISIMLWSAWAVFFNAPLPLPARLLIALGATSFSFSDISVARNTFVKPRFADQAWGLPLYYAGQFMLALSIALVP
jgi:uncharacterized membrane protein YhhN